MKKVCLCSVIAMLVFAGCQEADVCGIDNTTNESIVRDEVELTAYMGESSTRTYVGEDNGDGKRMMLWENHDTIAVFYGHESPSLFTIKSIEDDGTQATFKCSKVNREGEAINHYVGLYPYDANADIDYINKEYIITTTFPFEQYYKENSFGHNAAPMMAVASKDEKLSFKNMCTSVKILLKGATGTEKVSKIEVFSRDGRPMAGQWTYSFPVSGVLKDIEITPADEGTVDMITLYCGEGITLGSEEKGFIFTMPPMFFDDNQLIFRVYDEDGRYQEIVKKFNFSYLRSKIIEVGPYDYEKPTYAASVAGEVYESIEEAITVALDPKSDNDVELKIYKDIVLGAAPSQANSFSRTTREEDITLESDCEHLDMASLVVPAGKTLALDLNGHTMSQTIECANTHAMIENKGTLIIKGDGTISFTDTSTGNSEYKWASNTITNRGTLIIEDGTIQNKSEARKHASYTIDNYATLCINGGKVIFNNGHALRMGYYANKPVNTTITDGLIEGTRSIFMQLPGSNATLPPEMNLEIHGGELIADESKDGFNIYVYSDGQSGSNVSINITGGTFYNYIALGAKITESMQDKALSISGGTFKNKWAVFGYAEDEDLTAAKIAITGGVFASNYSAYYAWDDGYAFILNETTGFYEVMRNVAM